MDERTTPARARIALCLIGTLVVAVKVGAAQHLCLDEGRDHTRTAAAPSSPALASAPAGLSLLVEAPENGWARVVSPGAAFGAFVPAAACNLTIEPTRSAVKAPDSTPSTLPTKTTAPESTSARRLWYAAAASRSRWRASSRLRRSRSSSSENQGGVRHVWKSSTARRLAPIPGVGLVFAIFRLMAVVARVDPVPAFLVS